MISVDYTVGGLGTEPAEQYKTSVNTEVERQLTFTLGSQSVAIGLHCTKRTIIVAKVEVIKRAIILNSIALSHLRKPPILSRNNATDTFTIQIIKRDKISITKRPFPTRMTCARSK